MEDEINKSQLIDINETAVVEYYEIVKKEYEIERNKKISFENRAGLIMALLGTICVFFFENIKIYNIFTLMTKALSFITLIKIISGLSVYIFFMFTLYMIICTVNVKEHKNFEVKNIDEELLCEQRLVALIKIIKVYKNIIIQHRHLNNKRAKSFKKSLYGICATIVSIIIYTNFI